jgi:thymidylate synthase
MTELSHPPQFQYLPRYKPQQLICGAGQVAVVTGWTVKQTVAQRLDSVEYAVVGNLYSPTRGISPLLRNLIANPHVRFLVILDATKEDRNAGACQCLVDFLDYGFRQGKSDTGRNCWVINSPVTGYIDLELPQDILHQLRQALQWQKVEAIATAVEQVKRFSRQSLPPWTNPQTFPETEYPPTVLPGVRYGHRIEGRTIAATWVKILHRIKTTGTIRPTLYGQWQELIDLTAIVTDEPDGFSFPEPNYLPIQRQFIQDYIGQILDDAPHQEGVKYTYGQRLRSHFGRDQIEQVITKLAIEPDSSRAVMSLWDVADHENTDSPPCLNHIWLRIVDRELSLTATFRSNDMFSAWVANAMGLRALQVHIKEQIEARSSQRLVLGALITVSQSAHIYSDCWEHSDRVIASQYAQLLRQRQFDDPVGSFAVRIEEGQIVVEHLTPGAGEVVGCYAGKTAKALYQNIAATCPILQPEHALYLGTELQKAEFALREPTLRYQQDRPLF